MLVRLLNWTLDTILRNRLLFWACVLTNLGGALYGIFVWYRPMLEVVPAWTWPFVPVCPLAALAGTVALLAERYQLGWRWFYALTAIACIKWGMWTLAFWSYHWLMSGQIQPMEIALFVAHIGLICEGVLFSTRIGRLSLGWRAAVIGWFVLSFVIHYGLGYHPPLTAYVSESYVFWWSVVLLVPLCGALMVWPLAPVSPAKVAPVSR